MSCTYSHAHKSPPSMNLTLREAHAIYAGLRLLQIHTSDPDDRGQEFSWQDACNATDIASDGDTMDPLSHDEIDALVKDIEDQEHIEDGEQEPPQVRVVQSRHNTAAWRIEHQRHNSTVWRISNATTYDTPELAAQEAEHLFCVDARNIPFLKFNEWEA